MTASGTDRVRFVDLPAQAEVLGDELRDAVWRVVQRGAFILGEEVGEFEAEFARYCGVAHAVGVDSGFSALELTLRAMDLPAGGEVVTQANTFIATPAAIEAAGLRPVLVDCDEEGAFELSRLMAAVNERTVALMPVHLFGRVGDIDVLVEQAQARGLPVVEDACQAHGAVWHGRRAGSFGLAGAFSFYPAKNLGAFGDGGMVVTGSDDLAERLRLLRNYGARDKYEHEVTPMNRRLDTIHAAALLVKLRHLDGWNRQRQYLADAYREHLRDLPLGLPAPDAEGRHVYHLFVVQVEDRDGLRAALAEAGIETGVHYPVPCHLQPALADLGYRRGDFPNAERLAAHSLSLPMYPEMGVAVVERVAGAIRQHLAR